jgi:hypothetical protein
MWLVPPAAMCTRHLVGEHRELHMVVGMLRRGKNVSGYLEAGLLDIRKLVSRHAELVEEFGHRGFQHFSPIAEADFKWPTGPESLQGHVNIRESWKELCARCEDCEKLSTRYLEALERTFRTSVEKQSAIGDNIQNE